MNISIIVAVAQNGVIGNNGKIPWYLPSDLRRFRKITEGNTVLMGRKTWESLPKKPLPNRQNLVISSDLEFDASPATLVRSLQEAADISSADLFVIGGRNIILEALPIARRIFLTVVDVEPEGDVFLREVLNLDPKKWWLVTEHPEGKGTDVLHSRFQQFDRVQS